MRGYLLLRGAVWVIFCGGIVLFAAAVTHAEVEPSLWIRDGDIAKTTIEDPVVNVPSNRNPDCENKAMDVLDRVILVNSRPYPIYYSMTNECWMVSSGGISTGNGVGQMKLNKIGSLLRLNDPYYAYRFAGDKVIKWGGGPQRYFSTTTVIGDPAGSVVITNGYNVPITIGFAASHAKTWTINKPGTSTPNPIHSYAATRNGAWMVVASMSGYLRVNLDTREILPFEPITLPAGYENPSYPMAISENGRYVLLVRYPKAYMYDLSTCNADTSGNQIATGCGKRDITPYLSMSDGSINVSGLRFNDMGDGVTYYEYQKGTWRHYSLTAPGQAEHGIDYLALGDSYTSGEGDGEGGKYYLPGTDGDGATVPLYNTGISNYPYNKEKCHLSSRSYPYLLAGYAQLHSDGFRSVACSGADANDVGNTLSDGSEYQVFNGHYDQLKGYSVEQIINIKKNAVNNFIPGRAAQIEFVAKYKPKVLTIGLSGNDIDFGGKINECVTSLNSTCRYAGRDAPEIVREIKDNVYTRLGNLLRRVKSASPTTRIYVTGYPQLIGQGVCNTNVLLDNKEQAYIRAAVTYLNDVIEATAASAGVNYLDIEHWLDGVNLCSDQKHPAINGLTKGNDIYGIIGNESYHPNEQGHRLIAAMIKNTLGNASIVSYSPCESVTILHCNKANPQFPAAPMLFQPSIDTPASNIGVQKSSLIARDGAGTVAAGGYVDIAYLNLDSTLAPNSNVTAMLMSTPVNLSPARQLVTDAEGGLTVSLMIPTSIQPGVHTLHIIGIRRSGEPVDLYQSIWVAASMNDYDGDGIYNDQDICQFIVQSNIDSDEDGIDDACDGDLRLLPKPVVVDPPQADTESSDTSTPTNPVIQPGNTLGAATIAAISPYQGPITQHKITMTDNEGIDNGARANQESVTASTSDTLGDSTTPPDKSQQSFNTVSHEDQPVNSLQWYIIGGIGACIASGWIIYRIRR